MTNKGNKHKRGQRGSLEDQQGTPKRSNMADDAGAVEAATNEDPEQPSNRELKEMLVELQIAIAEIQRANNQFTMEVAGLRNTIEAQKREMAAMKSSLAKLLNQNQTLEEELYAARKKAEEQEQEIAELYGLQDNLEQYTRKNSLEMHHIPE